MNKIEKMIQELCPEGVEYKKLWTLTLWDKKFNSVEKGKQSKTIKYPSVLANELFSLEDKNGDVFLLSTGERTGWTTQQLAGEYLCEGEIVSIPWGKSRPVAEVMKYYKGKFVTADNRIATSIDTNILLNKFLYYILLSQSETIDGFYRGAGIQHPNMGQLLDMNIPVPPLPIQLEIVKALDAFTNYLAELQAELEARKEQYEYYRNNLLTFNKLTGGGITDNVRWMKLGEISDILTGFPFDSSKFTDSGIKLLRGKNIKRGYLDFNEEDDRYWESSEGLEKYLLEDEDIVISMDGSLVGRSFGVITKEQLPLLLVQRVARIRSSQANIKYLYFYITNFFPNYVDKVKTKGAIPHISMKDIQKFPIPIPPLSEQSRIVKILDQFETLVNDLTSGLPAEIAAVQEQYEYYRNRLLTFPAKA